jgi:AAT family amino acid transporter
LLFYVLGTAVIVSIMPWTETVNVSGVQQSPFVRLFSLIGVPAAADIMNAVVLTAALSAANINLYVASRMMHSLSLSGYAPHALGRTGDRRIPLPAVLASAAGLIAASLVSALSPDTAFPVLLGAALFTGMVTWLLIFATHFAFRRAGAGDPTRRPTVRLPGAPVTTALAMTFTLLVLVLTGFVDAFSLAGRRALHRPGGAVLRPGDARAATHRDDRTPGRDRGPHCRCNVGSTVTHVYPLVSAWGLGCAFPQGELRRRKFNGRRLRPRAAV